MTAQWNCLPEQVQHGILRQLGFEDHASCRLVCKEWAVTPMNKARAGNGTKVEKVLKTMTAGTGKRRYKKRGLRFEKVHSLELCAGNTDFPMWLRDALASPQLAELESLCIGSIYSKTAEEMMRVLKQSPATRSLTSLTFGSQFYYDNSPNFNRDSKLWMSGQLEFDSPFPKLATIKALAKGFETRLWLRCALPALRVVELTDVLRLDIADVTLLSPDLVITVHPAEVTYTTITARHPAHPEPRTWYMEEGTLKLGNMFPEQQQQQQP